MYSFSFSFVFFRLGLFTRYYIYYCIHTGTKNKTKTKNLIKNKENKEIKCVNACDVLILYITILLQRFATQFELTL